MTQPVAASVGKEEKDSLELCKDEDIPELVVLLNKAFSGNGWHNVENIIAGTRTSNTRLRQEMAHNPRGTFLQWMRNNQRLGCVFLSPTKESEKIWYLGTLSVDPTLHGNGMGNKLLKMSEEYAKQKGAITIEIHVIQVRVPLINWYTRRGYQQTGKTEPFPYGMEGVDPLRDDMHFLVMHKSLK